MYSRKKYRNFSRRFAKVFKFFEKEKPTIVFSDVFYSKLASVKKITDIIKLPETIEVLEASAFENCSKLEWILFGKNMTSIGGLDVSSKRAVILALFPRQPNWSS